LCGQNLAAAATWNHQGGQKEHHWQPKAKELEEKEKKKKKEKEEEQK